MADEIIKKADDATAEKIMDGNAPDGGGKAPDGATGPAGATGPGPTGAAQTGPAGATGPAGEIKFELKLPEGSLLDASAIERTVAFAKEQGLSPKAAQAMLDRESNLLSSNAERQRTEWDKATNGWMDASKSDKEFGGEAFPKNAELAKRVITRFGTPELMKGLTETGFGNHPELVRLMVRIGKEMDDDQLVMPGSQAAAAPKDIADVFYGSTEKKE
jgi:hypothetical protein